MGNPFATWGGDVRRRSMNMHTVKASRKTQTHRWVIQCRQPEAPVAVKKFIYNANGEVTQ
jgi:hypothetical protein